MSTPGEIRVGHGKSISLAQAQDLGLRPCIERMLNFTEHLRRLRVDQYEYVAMKVIVLVTSGEHYLLLCFTIPITIFVIFTILVHDNDFELQM